MRKKDLDTWLYLADQDWLIIQNSLSAERQPWALLSFHAQQAAEKCLKGVIAYHEVVPQYTHDLTALLATAVTFEPSLVSLSEDCNFLNQFAVHARYADIEDEFSEDNAHSAIAAAKRICSAIRNQYTTTP
jgi:HEPN domain-containing protein